MRDDCPYGACPCVDCMECYQEGDIPEWLQEQLDEIADGRHDSGTGFGGGDMSLLTVILEVGVEVPDDVDLDTSDGYDKALELAAEDVSTRGVSEIVEAITDIEYGGRVTP